MCLFHDWVVGALGIVIGDDYLADVTIVRSINFVPQGFVILYLCCIFMFDCVCTGAPILGLTISGSSKKIPVLSWAFIK